MAKLLKSDVLPGTNATIAGWGSVTTTLEKEKDHQLSQILRSLKVEVKPKDWCTSHLGDMSDNQFCTWYDKSANADFVNIFLFIIISFFYHKTYKKHFHEKIFFNS